MKTTQRAMTVGTFGGVLLLLATTPVPAQAPPARTLEDFAGRYRYAGGERDRAGLHRAIDEVVEQMNVLIRGFARRELRGRVQPERTWRIEGTGPIVYAFGDYGPIRIPVGGGVLRAPGPEGNPNRITARLQGRRLVTRFVTDTGSRTNWHTLSDDGRFMFIQVRIASGQLPADIRYSLTYRRR
jgi:hypothetical protein